MDWKTDLVRFIKLMCDHDEFARVFWDYEGRFIYCNKKFADMLGYRRRDIIGKTFDKFIHEDDVQRSYEEYEKNTKEGLSLLYGFRNRYYRQDGTIAYLFWHNGWNDGDLKIGSGQITEMTEREYRTGLKNYSLFWN